tara:strand:+ start:4383 stop:4769 length:387 start_codon:yes stop_codon:yes gene_type:complete
MTLTKRDTNLQVALDKLELTIDDMWEMTNKGDVLDVDFLSAVRKKSKVHGYGMFAMQDIEQGDVIGAGLVDRTHKTFLGRYTNHANNPNIKFLYTDSHNAVAIAVEDISEGEELFVDYPSHILNPELL